MDPIVQENGPTERDPLQYSSSEYTAPVSKFKKFKRNITVEPSAILILSASVLSAITTQVFGLDKACRVDLNFGNDICDALRKQNSNNYSSYEKLVQEYVAARIAIRSVIQSVVPCFILIFVGAWSDMTGNRRIVILLPIIGEILQCLSNIMNVVFFYQLPVEVLIYLDALFPALTGGWTTIMMGLFSYISDVTTQENRTHRLGYVSFCTYVGIPIGLGLSGVLLKTLGYYGAYGTALFLHLVNLTYVVFVIKDPIKNEDQKAHDGKGVVHFFKTFFDVSNVKETVRVVFKDGPNKRRLRMCVLLAVVTILFGPMFGEISVLYMNTRYRFNWDEVKFSMFQTYNFVTHTLGTIFSITVFSKYLQWHDSLLGIISTVSKIAASFIYGFAPNEKIFFAAPLVEILNGTSLLAMRSIVSKLVAPDEIGKVNSVFGLTENLMPLVYVPLYTKVYTATMEVLPGAVFLMGASMTTPAVAVFIWLFCEHRKQVRSLRHEKKETELE